MIDLKQELKDLQTQKEKHLRDLYAVDGALQLIQYLIQKQQTDTNAEVRPTEVMDAEVVQ